MTDVLKWGDGPQLCAEIHSIINNNHFLFDA